MGALHWSSASTRLATSRNFWLSTASAAARPHTMPVWGVWYDAEQRFAFSCAPGARKARNLEANPQCVAALDDTVECASIEGHAERLVDDACIGVWIDSYHTEYRPLAPDLDAAFLLRNVLYEFVPERAFGIVEQKDEFAQRATRWRF